MEMRHVHFWETHFESALLQECSQPLKAVSRGPLACSLQSESRIVHQENKNLLEAAGSCQPNVNFVVFERTSYRSLINWAQEYIIPIITHPSPKVPSVKSLHLL